MNEKIHNLVSLEPFRVSVSGSRRLVYGPLSLSPFILVRHFTFFSFINALCIYVCILFFLSISCDFSFKNCHTILLRFVAYLFSSLTTLQVLFIGVVFIILLPTICICIVLCYSFHLVFVLYLFDVIPARVSLLVEGLGSLHEIIGS